MAGRAATWNVGEFVLTFALNLTSFGWPSIARGLSPNAVRKWGPIEYATCVSVAIYGNASSLPRLPVLCHSTRGDGRTLHRLAAPVSDPEHGPADTPAWEAELPSQVRYEA
jgi:hypothetical protein